MRMFFLLLLLSLNAYPKTEVYFSPSTDCEDKISERIRSAKSEIVAAVYSINNKKLVDALIEAKNRGVRLRVLTDYIQANQKSSKVVELLNAGVTIRVHSKYKIEHNKFAVYDGKAISTGSFNWTGPAARSNSENCLFNDEAAVAKTYQDRFEFLWQKNSEEASKAKFAKILKNSRLPTSH